MNFTESFQEFSSKLSTTDLALYAGVGLVLWVIFRERFSPIQKLLTSLISKVTGSLPSPSVKNPTEHTTVDSVAPPTVVVDNKDDIFFRLIVSWKQTRDLSEKSGCVEAVRAADAMFPFLSPNVCSKKEDRLV